MPSFGRMRQGGRRGMGLVCFGPECLDGHELFRSLDNAEHRLKQFRRRCPSADGPRVLRHF